LAHIPFNIKPVILFAQKYNPPLIKIKVRGQEFKNSGMKELKNTGTQESAGIQNL
jgi:hypothetical protein